MEKICWANTENFDDAGYVIVGIPDESKSHSLRTGTEEAPSKIRQISNLRDSYDRDGTISLGRPFRGTEKKVCDLGDIERNKIKDTFEKISSSSKIPISIGGDHSITLDIITSLSKTNEKISLVYFDAHPDFVSSHTNYYGSVITDVLPNIDIASSIQIGIRTPEEEELMNIKKNNFNVITPFDINIQGLEKIANSVIDKLGKNVYVSFDMDCVDPSFAPGVSVPVPLGLNSVDCVYLLQRIAEKGIIGMDIMEVCPKYDVKDRTSHLASRIISEVLFSSGENNND
ncbi:agmatinase [Nitrosopumilus piranensis]|uniref:Agmatinase n=1 Tax=Nitrosopumilus piranensis TaxID=1582439 RepID=A0A0C5BVE8_9ARCH|nr:agmatinase [Nitrosopumilus piranensis]AJM92231.1 Agmatinase [Nitrosopumilus piranensis]